MVDEQIINWIRDNQSRGYSLDSLKGVLINQGYAEKEVSEAISIISGTAVQPTTPPSTPTVGKKSRKKLWWILGSVLGAFLILIIALLAMSSPTAPNNVSPSPPIVIPEPGPINNFGFSNTMSLIGIFQTENPSNLTMEVTGSGITDILNSDTYMKNEMIIASSSGNSTDEQKILSETYIVDGTMYSKMSGMGGLDSWMKQSPQGGQNISLGTMNTASPADTIKSIRAQSSNPDFTMEVISENPIEIRMTAKKDSPAMADAIKQFQAFMDMMSSLFQKGGMEFGASNASIDSLIINMKMDDLSRPLEATTTTKFTANFKAPIPGNCSKRNETKHCVEWEMISESGKMTMTFSLSMKYFGYNEQPAIVVPEEAKNAGALPISNETLANLGAGMSEADKQKLQDILASLPK